MGANLSSSHLNINGGAINLLINENTLEWTGNDNDTLNVKPLTSSSLNVNGHSIELDVDSNTLEINTNYGLHTLKTKPLTSSSLNVNG